MQTPQLSAMDARSKSDITQDHIQSAITVQRATSITGKANKVSLMDKIEVIKKVKKLLAVSDPSGGASTGEVDNALRLIDKLMRENNITMSEVSKSGDSIIIESSEFSRENTSRIWHTHLACSVAKLCETEVVRKTLSGTRCVMFQFIGFGDDPEISLETFNSFFETISNNSNYHYETKKEKRSYCEGYVFALNSKICSIKEESKESKETDLVFVGKKSLLIKKSLKEKGIGNKKTSRSGNNIENDSFFHGARDGRNADLSLRGKKKREIVA